MRSTLSASVCLAVLCLWAQPSAAQTLNVVETTPPAGATVDSLGEGLIVRFDKPVDHIRSLLSVRRGSDTVATLHPRFKTEPNVLFAQAPALDPGDYRLHWSVRNLDGSEAVEGEIAFTIRRK